MNYHTIDNAKDLVVKVANYHFVKSYQTQGNADHLMTLVEKAFDIRVVDELIIELNMFLLASRTIYDAESDVDVDERVEAFRYMRDKARKAIVDVLFANEINYSFKREAMETIEAFLRTLWFTSEEEETNGRAN